MVSKKGVAIYKKNLMVVYCYKDYMEEVKELYKVVEMEDTLVCGIHMLHNVDHVLYKKRRSFHKILLDLHKLLFHSASLRLIRADKVLLVYMESNMDLQKALDLL